MDRKLDATKGLIAINVVLFVLAFFVPATSDYLQNTFPLYFPLNESFQPFQVITHMFMHGSMGHLLMNMFGLFMFGSLLEKIWGPWRFLFFYFAVGLGAAFVYSTVNYIEYDSAKSALIEKGISEEKIASIITQQDLDAATYALFLENKTQFQALAAPYFASAVGASGAIYGILTAFGVLFPNAKLSLIFLPIPVAAKYFIPALLLFDLFSGLTGFSIFGGGVGIAHFAHIGGAVIGFIIMIVFKRQLPPPAYRPMA